MFALLVRVMLALLTPHHAPAHANPTIEVSDRITVAHDRGTMQREARLVAKHLAGRSVSK